MGWQTDEFGSSHQGTAGVLLNDGSEPKPVWIDSGSGGGGHRTSEWWAYNGHHPRPRASHLRASCSCGWRGESRYPIDWEAVGDAPHRDYDVVDLSGPRGDWDRHVEEVEARTVPVPEDVESLLERLEERLGALAGDSPLAALRAVAAVDRIVRRIGWDAAYGVDPDETSWDEIGKALGLTEQAAKSRLRSYVPDSVRSRGWSARDNFV